VERILVDIKLLTANLCKEYKHAKCPGFDAGAPPGSNLLKRMRQQATKISSEKQKDHTM
jgi:hypothetical protein